MHAISPKLNNILVQPLLPLLLSPPTRNLIRYNAIEDYSRRDVNTEKSVDFGDQLHVVCDGVACVEGAVLARLGGDGEEVVDGFLVQVRDGVRGELGEAAVGLVAGFVHEGDIKVGFLVGEKGGGELVEFGGGVG